MDNQQEKRKVSLRKLVHSGPLFAVSIAVIVVTLLLVWLTGLNAHHTLFINSLLSTVILSVAFFLFITIGLYKGVKMKDTVGKVTDRINIISFRKIRERFSSDSGSGIESYGCFESLEDLFLMILAAIVFVLLLWIFINVLWILSLVMIAMLYWLFFRALRLVFSNSARCKNQLLPSIGFGLLYTFLYNFWIFGVITAAHFLIR